MSPQTLSPLSPCDPSSPRMSSYRFQEVDPLYVSPTSQEDLQNLSPSNPMWPTPMRNETDYHSGRASSSSNDKAGPSSNGDRSANEGSGRPPLSGGASGSGFKGSGSVGLPLRRASRFDPMNPEGDEVDEGYGDLGGRHPLRRVVEEGNGEGMSLPSIKTLFGPSGEGPNSGKSHVPVLPPLVPASPFSSPNTSYRSRYSSLGSSFSTISEHGTGWWATDFESGPSRNGSLASSLPTSSHEHPPAPRTQSYPHMPTHSIPYDHEYDRERESKRRRSDQPVSNEASEESARIRWQAQTRNASLPTFPSGSGSGTPRNLMAPPHGTSLTRDPISPIPHPEKEPKPTVSRSASIVGGVLARSFADLTSADRARSPSMAPPTLPPLSTSADRRPSLFPPTPMRSDSFPPLSEERTLAIPSPLRSSNQPPPYSSNHIFTAPFSDNSRPRPPSPDRQSEPRERRASLTEIIKAETGDDIAIASGRAPGSAHIEQIEILYSPLTVPSENPDKTPGGSTDPDGDGEAEETGLEAMEVLAESATRVSEAEEADMEGEGEEADQERGAGGSNGQGSTGGPKYICVHCQKLFSRPSSLRIHTYSHTGERPYECPDASCRRRFSVQSNLKRHSKVHAATTSTTSQTVQPLPLPLPLTSSSASGPHQSEMYYHGSPISPMSHAQPHPHPGAHPSPPRQHHQSATPNASRNPQTWMYHPPIPPHPSRYPNHPDDRSVYGYHPHSEYRHPLAQDRREGEYPQFRGQQNPFYASNPPLSDGMSAYDRRGNGQNGYGPYEDRERWNGREREGERWRREEVGGGYRDDNRR